MEPYIKLLRDFFADSALQIENLRAGNAVIHLEMRESEMTNIVAKAAESAGWVVTRNKGCRISIEPRYPERCVVPAGLTLYHVSDLVNRPSIQISGLLPRGGGNTNLNRKYPNRLHLCADLSSALLFVRFQITAPQSGPAATIDCVPPINSFSIRSLDVLDIYTCPAPDNFVFYNDTHFQGKGIWTELPIPSDICRMMTAEEWHPLYQKLYPPVSA